MAKTSPKLVARRKRIKRIRKNIFGTGQKPRMRVFKSNRHIYVQIIDDEKQVTLAAASSKGNDLEGIDCTDKCDQALKVGEVIAQKALAAGISEVVYDRGGNLYHGRVKALSDGARKKGLKF
ncbi:MAG TPA: 50S ribosomal protein L18 [Desulfobulbus sp.]|nr:50S ribosomal protein L18 [Desulfobulbus sp.]